MWPNLVNQPVALGRDQYSGRSCDYQAELLGGPSSWTIIQENSLRPNFDGQGQGFAFTRSKRSSQNGRGRRHSQTLNAEPRRQCWNRRGYLQSHRRWNEDRLKKGRQKIQPLYGSEGDERAGIRDDRQSERPAVLDLPTQFFTGQLQVGDAAL